MRLKIRFLGILLLFRKQLRIRIRTICENDNAQLLFGLLLILLWIVVFVLFYLKPFTHH